MEVLEIAAQNGFEITDSATLRNRKLSWHEILDDEPGYGFIRAAEELMGPETGVFDLAPQKADMLMKHFPGQFGRGRGRRQDMTIPRHRNPNYVGPIFEDMFRFYTEKFADVR